MSFDFADSRLAWIIVLWDGLVQKDDDALAEKITHRIEVQVELVDRERLEQISASYAEDEPDDDEPPSPEELRRRTRANELSAFKALARDWRGVKDKGVAVPFSDENLARMLLVPGFSVGFNTAFSKALSGVVEAREKNSQPSRAHGRAAAKRIR